MKYLKIFEEFSRGEFTKLSEKQLNIARDYIKEKHPYINVDVDLHDIEVSSGIFLYKEEYYDNLEEIIDSKIPTIFSLYGIDKYTINNNLVDVDFSVNLSYKQLTKIPFNFGVVLHFNCSFNKLTTLEGSPHTVRMVFDCSCNELSTLIGAPKSVGTDFVCKNNKLITLEGSPKSVGGHFDCSLNELTTLEGGPQSVKFSYWCDRNKLISLKGAPKSIGEDFYFRQNQLTNAKYLPIYIGGKIYCGQNKDSFVMPRGLKSKTNYA